MIARLSAFLIFLLTAVFFAAAERETASGLNYTRPEGWNRTTDDETHAVILVPVDGHVSATFITGQDYTGDAAGWHRDLWSGITKGMNSTGSIEEKKQGLFHTSTAAMVRTDGTPIWVETFSLVAAGRGEGILYFGQNEESFRSHLEAVNAMAAGVTLASGPAEPIKSAAIEKAVVAPDSLALAVPPGWTSQEDPGTHVIFMKPPDVASIEDAVMMVFPPIETSDPAVKFHVDALNSSLKGFQLLEPVQKGNRNGMLASVAHYVTPQGKHLRLILYTARWGAKGQAVVFAAARDDLFKNYLPAVHAAISALAIPGGPAVATAAPTVKPGNPFLNPTASTLFSPTSPTDSSPPLAASASSDIISVLNYNEPANFYRGANKNFADYTSNEVKFSLCVYPFRHFTGNIVAQFQQTLLREWIDPLYQEAQLAGQPQISQNNLPGATAVFDARFHEAQIGQVNERMRILIVAGDMAALVDATAPNAFCWQKAGPSFTAMLSSLHVDKKQGPPRLDRGPGPGGAALAGLYVGTKPKYMAYGFVDFTSHVPALHYYLFSADGRVFRCYDNPPAGGDWRSFDFDNAQRTDARNTGHFAVRGNELYLRMDGPPVDEITTTIDDPTTLLMDTVQYRKQSR